MSENITDDEARYLITVGIPSDDIIAVRNGTAPLSTLMRVNMARSQNPNTNFRMGAGAPAPTPATRSGGDSPFTQPIGGTATRAPSSYAAGGMGNKNVSSGGSTLGKVLAGILGGNNIAQGALGFGQNLVKNLTPQVKSISQAVANGIAQGGQKTAASNLGAPKQNSLNVPGSDVLGQDSAVAAEEYAPPQLSLKDFTDQANAQAAEIYGPRYSAIDAAGENARGQYTRADALTAGLYDNLVKSVAKTASDTAARYGQANADQGAAAQNLSQNIGNTYSSSQNQMAGLLQQLGQGEAGSDVLERGAGDQAWNQSQAQTQGAAQQAAITQQGQGQQDYMANVGNAERTQGTVRREDLSNELGQSLAGLDQQRMNLTSDQSSAAMQLAQTLQDRDFALQQAQYGQYNDGFNARQSAAQLTQQQEQANRSMAYQMQQDSQAQSNADRTYDLQQSQYSTDLATKQAQLGLDSAALQQKNQPQGLAFGDQDPASQGLAQIASALGGNNGLAQQYWDVVNQLTSGIESSVGGNASDTQKIIGNKYAYVQYISEQAAKKGLNARAAQAAAQAFWNANFK